MSKQKADVSVKSQVIIGVTVALVTVAANLAANWIGVSIDTRRNKLLQTQERQEDTLAAAISDLDELIAICHQIDIPAQTILVGSPALQDDAAAWGGSPAPTGTTGAVMLKLCQKGTTLVIKMKARYGVKLDNQVFQFLNGSSQLGYLTIITERMNRPITNFSSLRELNVDGFPQIWIPPSLDSIPVTYRPPTSPCPAADEFTSMSLQVQRHLEEVRRGLFEGKLSF